MVNLLTQWPKSTMIYWVTLIYKRDRKLYHDLNLQSTNDGKVFRATLCVVDDRGCLSNHIGRKPSSWLRPLVRKIWLQPKNAALSYPSLQLKGKVALVRLERKKILTKINQDWNQGCVRASFIIWWRHGWLMVNTSKKLIVLRQLAHFIINLSTLHNISLRKWGCKWDVLYFLTKTLSLERAQIARLNPTVIIVDGSSRLSSVSTRFPQFFISSTFHFLPNVAIISGYKNRKDENGFWVAAKSCLKSMWFAWRYRVNLHLPRRKVGKNCSTAEFSSQILSNNSNLCQYKGLRLMGSLAIWALKAFKSTPKV